MYQNRNYQLNESGMIAVRNPAAFWIPQITVREEIHGGTFTVTGSYEGREPFVQKLERILARRLDDPGAETPDQAEDEPAADAAPFLIQISDLCAEDSEERKEMSGKEDSDDDNCAEE